MAVLVLDDLVDGYMLETRPLRKSLTMCRLAHAWRAGYDDVW